jgi:hypothetical protein
MGLSLRYAQTVDSGLVRDKLRRQAIKDSGLDAVAGMRRDHEFRTTTTSVRKHCYLLLHQLPHKPTA